MQEKYEQRVRSSFPDTSTRYYNNIVGGQPVDAFDLDDAYIKGGDVMVDFVTHTPPPWAFKPCDHVVWYTEAVRECGSKKYSDPSCRHHWWYSSGNRGQHHAQKTVFDLAGASGMESILPKLVSFDHYAFRIKRMIEKGVSELTDSPTDLVVFLLELSEIKQTARYIAKRWKILTDLQGGAMRGLGYLESLKRMIVSKSSSSGILKLTADTLSDDLLQISFGIVPLVSDTSKLIKRVNDFWKTYEDLIKGNGKAHKLKKRFVDDDFDPGCDEDVPDDYTCPNGQCQINLEHWDHGWVSPEVCVTLFYRYALPDDWKTLGGKLGYALSAIGIKPGLSTVWERIPFSFVVDWVFSVGQLLEPFKYDPARIKVELLDVCASLRSGRTGAYHHKHCIYDFGATPVFRVTRADYTRRVGKELLNALPPLKLPTNFQLLLGAALLWTRGANKHLR